MKKCLLFLMAVLLLTYAEAQEDSTAAHPPNSLLSFQVQAVEKVVLLKWAIEVGWEYKSFEVERSDDGINFIKVGSRLGINKNHDGGFDFVDATPRQNTSLHYRLKLISADGFFTYSDHKEARVAPVQWAVRLKQNPVRNDIELVIDAAKSQQATVAVVSNAGQQIMTQTFRLSSGKNGLTLSSQGIQQGLYQLIVQTGSERKTISFIKE